MVTYILGVGCFFHDSSACLLKDGELLCAIEEERMNRVKHANGFPEQAIAYCLDQEGITLRDVHTVAYYADPWVAVRKRIPNILRHLPGSLGWASSHGGSFWESLRLKKTLAKTFGDADVNVVNVKHHMAHAASCFFLSPFEEAAILTVDGVGEWATAMLAVGRDRKIEPLREINFPASLGKVWAAVTSYLGFTPNADEGKVMGLSPYGDAKVHLQAFRELLPMDASDSFAVDGDYFPYHLGQEKRFSEKFVQRFGTARSPEEPIEERHWHIAAALQARTEEICQSLVDHLHQQTGLRNLTMAGGVALNSVMNAKVFLQSKFEDIFIPAPAGDGGAAIGAAYYVHHQLMGRPRGHRMRTAFVGSAYTRDACLRVIEAFGLAYSEPEDLAQQVAARIDQGRIVAWFQGRMEIGPRALGNRSILADPRRADMKETLNKRVKHREAFRPFAPSILREKAATYFSVDYPSPFMLLVFPIRAEKQDEIPAVTHVDGTGRIQTVTEEDNAPFHALLTAFDDLTGCPVLLNTSFNVRGEPIVESPTQAIEGFLKTGIDDLVLGSFLLSKPECRDGKVSASLGDDGNASDGKRASE